MFVKFNKKLVDSQKVYDCEKIESDIINAVFV